MHKIIKDLPYRFSITVFLNDFPYRFSSLRLPNNVRFQVVFSFTSLFFVWLTLVLSSSENKPFILLWLFFSHILCCRYFRFKSVSVPAGKVYNTLYIRGTWFSYSPRSSEPSGRSLPFFSVPFAYYFHINNKYLLISLFYW